MMAQSGNSSPFPMGDIFFRRSQKKKVISSVMEIPYPSKRNHISKKLYGVRNLVSIKIVGIIIDLVETFLRLLELLGMSLRGTTLNNLAIRVDESNWPLEDMIL